MRNKAEELAPIYPFLITFQRRSSAGFDDTLDEEADFGEFGIHMVDKEVESNDNQTTGE